MLKFWFRMLVVVGVVGSAHSIAQLGSSPRLYQITSGKYVMIGGIWGSLTNNLPSPQQMFILLKQDGTTIDLTLLGEDQRTAWMVFTNGVLTNNAIRFRYEVTHPYPDVTVRGSLDYNVVQSEQVLRLEGSSSFEPVCCDIPFYFAHVAVEAVEVPLLSIRASEVEVCWSSSSNFVYQVQYKRERIDGSWVNLGDPIPGNEQQTCIIDKVPLGESQRVYRVVILR